MFIVFTTVTHPKPQIFTIEKVIDCNFNQFFNNFCGINEIISAVLFDDKGSLLATYDM